MKTGYLIAGAISLALLAGCGHARHAAQAHINGARVAGSQSQALQSYCAIARPQPYDANTGSGMVQPFYTVTMYNNGSQFASVSGFGVVFSDGGGNELGSDSQEVSGIIAPGQLLSWNVNTPASLISNKVVSTDGGPDGDEMDQYVVSASTCQVAGWQ